MSFAEGFSCKIVYYYTFFEKAISKHAEVSKFMQKSVLPGPILAWLCASFLALACRSAKGILHKTCFTNSQSPFA